MKLAAVSSAFAALLCAVRFIVACSSPKGPESPPMPVFPDAGAVEVEGSPLCRVMCENLGRMGCPESATPVEAIDGGWAVGRSCVSTCTVAEKHGRNLRTICVANASTPDQIRLCCPKGSKGCTPVTCEPK